MLYCTILQALALLERIIWADPTTNLQEGLLFNLCTIYELESSYSLQKKQKLLEFVSKHRGDGFNISCLKIPWCSRYLLADVFKNKTRTWLKEKEIRQYTRVDKRHGEWYCVLRIFNRLRAFSHFSSSGIVVLVTCEKWARLEKRGRLPLPSRYHLSLYWRTNENEALLLVQILLETRLSWFSHSPQQAYQAVADFTSFSLESLSFTYTANGKRQIQVEKFSDKNSSK